MLPIRFCFFPVLVTVLFLIDLFVIDFSLCFFFVCVIWFWGENTEWIYEGEYSILSSRISFWSVKFCFPLWLVNYPLFYSLFFPSISIDIIIIILLWKYLKRSLKFESHHKASSSVFDHALYTGILIIYQKRMCLSISL